LDQHEHVADGRLRVLIERVRPEIDGGRYPIKRVVGDLLVVEADLIPDGHDIVGGVLLYRPAPAPGGAEGAWQEIPLEQVNANDRFRGAFTLTAVGTWQYTVIGWINAFSTWQRGTRRKHDAGQDIHVELLEGAALLAAAAGRATEPVLRRSLEESAALIGDKDAPMARRVALALAPELAMTAARAPDRARASNYPRVLEVTVDPPRARFSAWYEMFPRSFGQNGRHGTFADAERVLPYVAGMGFDVLYLPPIHPIGRTYRKGKNNTLVAQPDDVGSPWAVGAEEGGHKAVHPELGTLADFERFVRAAREQGLEVALDIVFQASPDHPYVKEHPEWFKHRPDGTIQYAENPPKKYQDVYPFDFECDDWRALWEELKSVFLFWIERGVRIFRVDNPHTKPLPFWAWCIREVKAAHPDVLFLAEAFTRPTLMYALAKLGYSQSYTYFTWRTTKDEFVAYLTELTRTEVAEFYRPNFWPNTPDILPEHLQQPSRPMYISRIVLAATLSSNWGMYGPALELMEHVPRPGAEEYIDNEKYELKRWDIERAGSLRHVIARVNQIRRENPALQQTKNLRFHRTDNDFLLCFSKEAEDGDNLVLVVVNLDPHHTHAGWIELDLPGVAEPSRGFQVHDLLSEARFHWKGPRCYVELDPRVMPAHIFRVRRFVRSEHQFEYFL
jgi:starch synthase (maltosyl-transferring)